MAVTTTKNVWGAAGGIEAQRADLWALDLQQVIAGVRRNLFQNRSADIQADYVLPEDNTTYFYARTVTFPVESMAADEFRDGNNPQLFPGFDQPYNTLQVEFMLEAAQAKSSVSEGVVQTDTQDSDTLMAPLRDRSKIWNLLEAWKLLARVGRLPFGQEPRIALNIAPQSYGNTFKFDVPIYCFRGRSAPIDFDNVQLTQLDLDNSLTWVAQSCWIQSLQLGTMDQNGNNTPLTVTAMIVANKLKAGLISGQGNVVDLRPGT